MMADGSSFATAAEFYSLTDGVLTVKTVGLPFRRVEGVCIGVTALERPAGIRTIEELAARTTEEFPPT